MESMKIKWRSILLCHWTLKLEFGKDFALPYESQYMGHSTMQISQYIAVSIF